MDQALLVSDLTLHGNVTKEVMVHEKKNWDNSMQDTLLDKSSLSPHYFANSNQILFLYS